ncbi:MAG: hypothetical protein ACTSQP_20840 [Promethearchaeota archaeon]
MNKIFELIYSKKRMVIYGYLIPFIILFCFIDIFLPIFCYYIIIVSGKLGIIVILITCLVVFNIVSVPSFYLRIKESIPYLNVKFTISNDFIEIKVQDQQYLNLFWKDLIKVEIIKIKWQGIKIIFKGKEKSYSIRLDNLIQNKKYRNIIINKLEFFSKINNISCISIIRKGTEEDWEEEKREMEKINNLRLKSSKINENLKKIL